MCNVAQFLIEQETACRDIALVTNRNEALSGEWQTVAEDIMAARQRHFARCEKCRD